MILPCPSLLMKSLQITCQVVNTLGIQEFSDDIGGFHILDLEKKVEYAAQSIEIK